MAGIEIRNLGELQAAFEQEYNSQALDQEENDKVAKGPQIEQQISAEGDCNISFAIPATNDNVQYLLPSNDIIAGNRVFKMESRDSMKLVRDAGGKLWAQVQAREAWNLLDKVHITKTNDTDEEPLNDLDVIITSEGSAFGGAAAGTAKAALGHVLSEAKWGLMFPDAIFSRTGDAYKADGSQVLDGVPRYETGVSGQAISVEEGTTNLLSANQASVETDTVGFAATGSTISRDLTQYWHGAASLKTITNNVVVGEGFYLGTTSVPVVAGLSYTGKIQLKGAGALSVYFRFYTAGGATISDSVITSVTLSGVWQEVLITPTVAPATAAYITIMVRTSTQQGITFYADGLQIEQKAYCTSWQLPGTARNAERLKIPAKGIISLLQGTLEFWAYITDNTKALAAGRYPALFCIPVPGSASAAIAVFHHDATAAWYLMVNGVYSSPIADTTTATGWNKFKVKWKKNEVKFYINGVLAATVSGISLTTNTDYLSTDYIDIGSSPYWTGISDCLFDFACLSSRYSEDWEDVPCTTYPPIDTFVTASYLFDTSLLSEGANWPTGNHDIRMNQESVLSVIRQCQSLWDGYLQWNSITKGLCLQSSSWAIDRGYQVILGKNMKAIKKAYDFNVVNKLWVFGTNDADITDSNVLNSGACAAAGAATITLAAGALAWDDIYNGAYVNMTSGAGANQTRRILDYNGTTLQAIVDAWTVVPAGGDTYTVTGSFLIDLSYATAPNFTSEIIRNQDIFDDTELLAWATAEHAKVLAPRLNYELEQITRSGQDGFTQEGFFNAGEYVKVIEDELSITTSLRVIAHRYNVFRPELCSCEVGDEVATVNQLLGNLVKKSRTTYKISRSVSTLTIADGLTTKDKKRADIIIPKACTTAQHYINEAIEYMAKRGGNVALLDGEFIVDERVIYQRNVTLSGQGRSSIIKAKVLGGGLHIPTLLYASGIEFPSVDSIGVRDLVLDGNGGTVSIGIFFSTFSNMSIINVHIKDMWLTGMTLTTCQQFNIQDNLIEGGAAGIWSLLSSTNSSIINNTIKDVTGSGIILAASNDVKACLNRILADTANFNYGISIDGGYGCEVSLNKVKGAKWHGIYLWDGTHDNLISTNTVVESSQAADNTYDQIHVTGNSDRNTVQGNICRHNGLANKARYGIRINTADCDDNQVTNNDLLNSAATASLSDAGTGTITAAGNRL